MGSSLPEKSKVTSGQVGISLAINTTVCSITSGKGRYTVRGSARHSLADGVKLSAGPAGSLVDIATIPNAAGSVGTLPPIILDVLNSTDVIVLRLAVATGGADSASGILSVQLEQPL